MLVIILVGTIALGALFIFDENKATKMTQNERIKDAIRAEIANKLRLPNVSVDILYAQAVLETGNFASKAFSFTSSLFNRHKGSGKGDWTKRTYYANQGDADLRVYDDVYQSARDMLQLLHDPLYAQALLKLRQGDSVGYYTELQKAGFSTDSTYAVALSRTYASLA